MPAVPPADGSGTAYNQTGFTFDLLGVRVPAIVVSPLIAAGTVDHTVYDHSSVLATVERLFGFGALTARDAAANDVRHLFTQATGRTDCPTTLPPPVAGMGRVLRDSAVSEATASAEDALPVAEAGNLAAFLATARKAAYDTYATTPAEQAIVEQEYAEIATRGDAKAFAAKVMAKATRFRDARQVR